MQEIIVIFNKWYQANNASKDMRSQPEQYQFQAHRSAAAYEYWDKYETRSQWWTHPELDDPLV
jgi:hypothetical protein